MRFVPKGMLLFCILPVLISCASQSTKEESTAEGSRKKAYTVRFNPPVGSQFQYYTTNDLSIIQTVNDSEVKTSNHTETELLYEVVSDNATNKVIQIQFKKFKTDMDAGGQQRYIDAEQAIYAYDPSVKIFGAFKDATFRAAINDQSEVVSVSGLEKITNKMYELGEGDPQAVQMIQALVKQQLSSEAMKTILEQQQKVIPFASISEGQSWTQEMKASPDVPLTYPVTYTVKLITDETVLIQLRGKIDLQQQKTTANGSAATYSLEGEQNGEIALDVRSGMINRSAISFNAEGTMSVMGMEIPVKISTHAKTMGKRLK